jgi:hypothetical protein
MDPWGRDWGRNCARWGEEDRRALGETLHTARDGELGRPVERRWDGSKSPRAGGPTLLGGPISQFLFHGVF